MSTDQKKLFISSWNVLHIIHELNYAADHSLVLEKYNDKENERLDDIITYITARVKLASDILCFQEVPGDLYDRLESKFPNYTILGYRYERQPKLRKVATNPYKNTDEYLVILIANDIVKFVTETKIVQFDDKGKAAQLIKFSSKDSNGFDLCVVNVHLNIGKAASKSLRQVFEKLAEQKWERYFLIGDLNMSYTQLKKELDQIIPNKYFTPYVNGNTHISKYGGQIKLTKKTHIVASNDLKPKTLPVIPNDSLSDHYMVSTSMEII
ncbi:MAG: endonuclease/exonuclease/phosphatase family protein [Hyperionvirus sp.]|uniref:Endonuclease/exonuclease/phosphatase family protein n=1 Tax=Hyperionvirus sp. TaxID=2487770 RepID=A0A3G5A9T9_9VIRU|nr:MAG: endonuclease/exonuclease/phosphatase family protein [Hyperionvirus sp.]